MSLKTISYLKNNFFPRGVANLSTLTTAMVGGIFMLTTFPAWSASVTSVKNTKAVIDLEGSEAAPGDEFFLINPHSNKKTAIIRLKIVKGGKALADILKGSAEVGYSLQAKGPSSANLKNNSEQNSKNNSDAPSAGVRDTTYLHNLKNSYGVMGEYLMNSMSVAVKNTAVTPTLTDTVALKGSSFGVGGFYDYVATTDFVAQLSAFFEQMNATGTSSIPGCAGGTSTACDVKITYLSFYGTAKYYFTQSHYRVWAGLGGGFLVAMSKSASALNEANIATNQILTGALGADIQMNRRNYIPISIQYNYFPPTDTVKATSIVIRSGWAWNF